jgi:thioredoxin-dependent peroxiredoxin
MRKGMDPASETKETHLKGGEKAPEFTLPDQNSRRHNLADYRGQRVLLYFYPEDDTRG